VGVQNAGKQRPTDEDDAVTRRAGFGADMSEDFSRQHVIPAHSEQKARSSKAPSQRAAKSRDDEDGPHAVEQQQPSDEPANVHECGFEMKELAPVRPDTRAQVNFDGAKNSGKEARQHGGQEN